MKRRETNRQQNRLFPTEDRAVGNGIQHTYAHVSCSIKSGGRSHPISAQLHTHVFTCQLPN